MVNIKGNDTRFIKCEKDNIIFVCTKKSIREFQSTCPICNKDICYYCSIHLKQTCCIKRSICIIFQKVFKLIFNVREEHDDPLNSPIPLLFFFFLFLIY